MSRSCDATSKHAVNAPTLASLTALTARLHSEGCTLVVLPEGSDTPRCYNERGVATLYHLYTEQPALLRGASIADKVVGKGAAALMVAGGVARLHALVLSMGAQALLDQSQVAYTYDALVPHIINRSGTDWCPIERLCHDCTQPRACIARIADFVARQAQQSENPT